MAQPLAILVTGGTFDKQYDELSGRLFFRDTHVAEMLRLGRSRLDITIETVMMVDSLDMNDEARASIVERCRARSERSIVITHGTDTMVETAAGDRAGGARRQDHCPDGRDGPLRVRKL